jgi:ATP-dependent exoDNAse (exonuclease V) alpha subunit
VRGRLLAPDGLTGQDATFDHAQLTKAVYQAATGLLTAKEAGEFLQRFTVSPDLVPVATPRGSRFTTALLLAQEQRIVQTARAKAATPVVAPQPELVDRMVEVAGLTGLRLSQEQRTALDALAAPVGWASLEGHAGTGKTTLVHILVRAYQANGQPVILVSTAAETATRTAREVGLDRGWTVEAFTRAVTTGQLQPGASWVVLVEEAAMMDSHRMANLLEAAGPASIRTLGDPEQAQPVGAGGWHQLVDQVIGGHATLTTVIRQHHPADRAVCTAIRDGHAHRALASLQARGRLHLSPDPSTAVKELVHAWERHRQTQGVEGVAIVTDTDNATVDTLNALCQAKRHAAGELTGPAVTVADRLTGRGEQVYAGDRVRFIRPFITGDPLRSYVANGTGGHIRTVDAEHGVVVVGCDDGRTITLQPDALEEAQPLRLGYAGHALKLQGGQAPVVLVLPGGWQTSRQSAYSMATRCVEELHVFVDAETQQRGAYRNTDPIRALGARWSRDARKLAASIQGLHQDLDASPERPTVDDLVVAPPEGYELPGNSQPQEPLDGRDTPDGLGIEP